VSTSNGRRYAWVLAGRYAPGNSDAAKEPRTEFIAFTEMFGAELISRSTLDGPLPWSAIMLRRLGYERLSLARYMQRRTGEFDAIIASGEDIGIPLALASLFSARKTPIHMMFHGHHLHSRKLRWLAVVLRHMKHVHFHCLSQALAEQTRKIMKIPPARCHATGHGVDTDYFCDGPRPAGAMVVSAGAANRDYVTLGNAVRGLEASVKIAADSAWVAPGHKLISGAWPKNVEIHSYGSYAKLRALYGQASFAVVPLHAADHACGYAVIAEAMAMGLATIVTRTAAPPDFLDPGVTGEFVEVGDVSSLRARITDFLLHPEKAATLGRQARHLIETQHSLPAFCKRLEAIVRESHSAVKM